MGLSVNTNPGALNALQYLNATNFELNRTQNRINTGLKVSGAKDNAAIFSIAQKMRGNIAAKNAIGQGLRRAQSTVDVALAAAEAISDTLVKLKELAVRAKQSGQDAATHTALNNDFLQLRDQIDTIAGTAEFNGTNLVKFGAVDLQVATDENGNTFTIPKAEMAAIVLQFGLPNIDLTNDTNAGLSLLVIDNAIATVNGHLSSLGSAHKRLEIVTTLNEKLSDAFEVGVGNLVDADLARESASLQALQVKQQLGLQALAISNQAPQAILSLFG